MKDIKETHRGFPRFWWKRSFWEKGKTKLCRVYKKFCGNNMGIKMCGIMDTDGSIRSIISHFQGKDISSKEDLIIERHAARESLAGVCEDVRIGSGYFICRMPQIYKKGNAARHLLSDKISTSFSGLLKGKILFQYRRRSRVTATGSDSANQRAQNDRSRKTGVMQRQSESPTLEDIDTLCGSQSEDFKRRSFSIVDTLFMPYGLECDHYQVKGKH